jgi:hypothetical protein
MARRRVSAELAGTGVKGFDGIDLLIRPKIKMEGIVSRSEVAVGEISTGLDQLAPRPLLTSWLSRRTRLT